MYKNGWILFLILLCVAFLVSCGKKEAHGQDRGELVKIEAGEKFPGLCYEEENASKRKCVEKKMH